MKSLNNGSDDRAKLDKKSSLVEMVGQRDRSRGELSRNERGWKKGKGWSYFTGDCDRRNCEGRNRRTRKSSILRNQIDSDKKG